MDQNATAKQSRVETAKHTLNHLQLTVRQIKLEYSNLPQFYSAMCVTTFHRLSLELLWKVEYHMLIYFCYPLYLFRIFIAVFNN